jgi:hypothetical protein
MAGIQTKVRTSVKSVNEGGRRKLFIEVNGPEEVFFTADLLASKGIIRKLDKMLKESAKLTTIRYIKSAEDCLVRVKELKTRKSSEEETTSPGN